MGYRVTFEDEEILKDALESCGLDKFSPAEFCYQLTAYEKGYQIDYDKAVSELIMNEGDIDDPSYTDWNDYCDEMNYYDDQINSTDDFDEVFSGTSLWDMALTVYYGNFNPHYDYFMLDGNNNVKSLDDSDVNSMMRDDKNFQQWYAMNKYPDMFEDDVVEQFRDGCMQLVKQGY